MGMLQTWQEMITDSPKSQGSIVEDLRNFVENASPVDRPALALLRKSKVRTAYVEWLEDQLNARGANAWPEGTASTTLSMGTPTRLTATVQTFASWGMVTDLQRAVEHAGLDDMFYYQESKQVKRVLNDIEHAIHRGSVVTGASGTARQFRGFLNIFTTNMTSSSGTTLTEDKFGDITQAFVDNGTEIKPRVCFTNSFGKRTISLFSTKVTRNIEAAARQQLLVVNRYEGDFGDIDIYYSRDQLKSSSVTLYGNSFTLIDPDYFELGWLQSLMSETLARNGLRTEFQISAVLTLIYRTEKAGGGGKDYVAYIPPAT